MVGNTGVLLLRIVVRISPQFMLICCATKSNLFNLRKLRVKVMTKGFFAWARLLFSAFFCVDFAVNQTVRSYPGLYHGPGINADALNNTRIGGTGSHVGRMAGKRWVAMRIL